MKTRTAIVEESGYDIEKNARYINSRHYDNYSVYKASTEKPSYLPLCCDMLKWGLKSMNTFKLTVWPHN